jgi:hypothetical protein
MVCLHEMMNDIVGSNKYLRLVFWMQPRRGDRHGSKYGIEISVPGREEICLWASLIQFAGAPISVWDTPSAFYFNRNIEIVRRKPCLKTKQRR